MKRRLLILAAVIPILFLAACSGGPGGKQTIGFQGFTMEIPADWEAQESTLSDDYAMYEKESLFGPGCKLLLTDIFGLMDEEGDTLERAGAYFKEFTEDDASYSDVSDPVAGKFAGTYDMHTIDCTYNVIKIDIGTSGEASYPCKLIRVYMGDHDVEIRFSSEDGDFEAFDAAIAGAVCE